ncbi:MAG: permease prefix domain 2-containing transporter [Candidatus Acidiferrum sp.]
MYGAEIQPPKAAKWLLDLFTPYEEAESIHGDLLEEFLSFAAANGQDDARHWYWRQCLKSVLHLFGGAFRRSPWRLVGAIVIGQLSMWLGSTLPEDAIFATLHLIRNHVTPYHADWYSYVMWLNYAILVGRLLLCFMIGFLVAFIAKGAELVATICLNVAPFVFAVAILPFAHYVSPHIHPALLPMLLNMVEFPIMIVLGGWVVRDMRVRAPKTS